MSPTKSDAAGDAELPDVPAPALARTSRSEPVRGGSFGRKLAETHIGVVLCVFSFFFFFSGFPCRFPCFSECFKEWLKLRGMKEQ